MENVDDERDASRSRERGPPGRPRAPSAHRVPCNDATCRVRPISAEEQSRNAGATADLVERMLAMLDEDPPGAWEEAMRDLHAHRPH